MRYSVALAFALAVGAFVLPVMESVQAQSRTDTGKVIAIREQQLKEGADTAAFEKFVREEYNPAVDGTIPGVKMYIMKGDRGEKKGSYLFVYEFDSARTRDAIFPTEGEGPSETFAPFFEELPDLSQEFAKYLASPEDSSDVYTDYVMVK